MLKMSENFDPVRYKSFCLMKTFSISFDENIHERLVLDYDVVQAFELGEGIERHSRRE